MDSTRQKELDEFRKTWQLEVQQRHDNHSQPLQTKFQPPQSNEDSGQPTTRRDMDGMDSLENQIEALHLYNKGKLSEPKTAIEHYIVAIEHERHQRLGKALAAYRQAFRLDPDVDRDYQRNYQHQEIALKIAGALLPDKTNSDFRQTIPVGVEYETPVVPEEDPLQDLVKQITQETVSYVPRDENKPVLIASLPNEIMERVMQCLVVYRISTIAKLALVCKKLFLLTRSPSLWKHACQQAYKSPTMTMEQSREAADHAVKAYGQKWLRMFIERPRIHYDGVYIAICRYLRQGASDSSWSQPIHVITYYRYLRFFPDGTVLKHVTCDEPMDVVRLLKPDLERPRTFRGQFTIDHDTIQIHMNDLALSDEDFEMVLEIKSTHRGRHNKLSWKTYESLSTNMYTGVRETHPYDLQRVKPYFFSRVKSFVPTL